MGVRAKVAAAAMGVGTVAVPGGGVEGIPDRALVAYVAAAAGAPCPVPWSVLAAMGAVESGHGTSGGAHLDTDGRMTRMAVSWADARGPMQFLEPTWEVYGEGGDVNDIDDAAPATARMLCANGYESDPTDAIGAYNGGGLWRRYGESQRYVQLVDEYATAYAEADPRVLPSVSKERSPQRLWDSLIRGWMRVGGGARSVGLGRVWERADDTAFGVSTGAATRPDNPLQTRADGLDPVFGERLDRLIADAPGTITVISGRRTAGEQEILYRRYLDGVGNLAAYSDGVTCTSDHCTGEAADLRYGDPAVQRWAHTNAGRYGLEYGVAEEPWHVNLP